MCQRFLVSVVLLAIFAAPSFADDCPKTLASCPR